MRFKIDFHQPETNVFRTAAKVLLSHGVVLHATETVYGLAAVWDDLIALEKVIRLKQRPAAQPFTIMVARVDEMLSLIGWQDETVKYFLEKIYPAPLTVLLKRRRELPSPFWNRFPELGFRIPDSPVCQQLLKAAGRPLITTSANLTGEPPPATPEEVNPRISKQVDCFIDSGPCLFRIPSTIVKIDWDKKGYRVIRKGAYEVEAFHQLWERMVR